MPEYLMFASALAQLPPQWLGALAAASVVVIVLAVAHHRS